MWLQKYVWLVRDVLMEDIWKMFCKSGCKSMFDLSWEKIRLIWKNDNWHQYWGLGTKTGSPWNMMIWSRCTGMIGNLALYPSVLCSWTGNIFISKVEIHHFLHWKYVLLQSLQKANFNQCLTISNLISMIGSDSFQFISKTSKGTRQDDVQIQIDIKLDRSQSLFSFVPQEKTEYHRQAGLTRG